MLRINDEAEPRTPMFYGALPRWGLFFSKMHSVADCTNPFAPLRLISEARVRKFSITTPLIFHFLSTLRVAENLENLKDNLAHGVSNVTPKYNNFPWRLGGLIHQNVDLKHLD